MTFSVVIPLRRSKLKVSSYQYNMIVISAIVSPGLAPAPPKNYVRVCTLVR